MKEINPYLCTRMEQMEERQPYDVIVVGAGAAGMRAAGAAAGPPAGSGGGRASC